MTWLTMYNKSGQIIKRRGVVVRWQGDPSVPGRPDIMTGGVRIWNLGNNLRLVATLDPLVKGV